MQNDDDDIDLYSLVLHISEFTGQSSYSGNYHGKTQFWNDEKSTDCDPGTCIDGFEVIHKL